MKITSGLLITISTIVALIPTAVFSHPGHGASSVTIYLQQALHHAGEYYAWFLLFAVILFGLSVRTLINK